MESIVIVVSRIASSCILLSNYLEFHQVSNMIGVNYDD